ncbi:MAG: hypothetical protein U0893_25150 [Chloroflexota bacterium]
MRRYTRDRAVIQQWVEERGGQPAQVRGADVPRIAFGPLPPNWEPLSWPALFELLDRTRTAFMYEDSPGSRIFKLVKGHTLGE